MAFQRFIVVFVCFLVLAVAAIPKARASGAQETHFGFMMPALRSGCRGTVAECLDTDEEFGLDSESNRRILATKKYISYGAMQRNNVPCSRRGASYYNCRPGAQANPYSRGCSAITRCRR